jgi:protoporphyrinogen oxidase
MTVYILGAGPTGLATVDGLVDEGRSDFCVIEKSATLGGLAATLTWDGRGDHDLGPHKVFTTDAALQRRVEALLGPNDWIDREKTSRIWMHGRFLRYPPAATDLIATFGAFRFLRMGLGYALAALVPGRRARVAASFEADLRNRVGAPLYDALFRPIAEKLWGEPNQLDSKLSLARVQTPPLGEAIVKALGRRTKESTFEALTFRYPRGGLGRLWSRIRAKGDAGRWRMRTTVRNLVAHGNRIEAIETIDADGHAERIVLAPEDRIVSTLPLGPTAAMLAGYLGEERLRIVREQVRLNDLLLVFLQYRTPSLLDESWIFVPDPSIIFHRVSEQESFDPSMTPGGTIVCCEVMSNAGRPNSDLSDDELVAACRADLAKVLGRLPDELAARVIRLPKSYPVYRVGHATALTDTLRRLDALSNFRTIGRQGAFNYIGTLDAMDIGYGCARWLATGDDRAWAAERERTAHYPVLD